MTFGGWHGGTGISTVASEKVLCLTLGWDGQGMSCSPCVCLGIHLRALVFSPQSRDIHQVDWTCLLAPRWDCVGLSGVFLCFLPYNCWGRLQHHPQPWLGKSMRECFLCQFSKHGKTHPWKVRLCTIQYCAKVLRHPTFLYNLL